jgi:hypothetical protein
MKSTVVPDITQWSLLEHKSEQTTRRQIPEDRTLNFGRVSTLLLDTCFTNFAGKQ